MTEEKETEEKSNQQIIIFPKDDPKDAPKLTVYARRFALVSFPSRSPKGRIWKRSNGQGTLMIEGGAMEDPKTGNLIELKVPSGIIPRRILIYLSQQRAFNKRKGIHTLKMELGNSLASFLKNMNLQKGGKTYKIITEQSNRLFNAKIAYHSYNEQRYHVKQALFASEYELFWSKIETQESFFPSYVEITPQLAMYLDNAIPLNLETILALGNNCLAFDLYAWLAARLFDHTGITLVTWKQLHDQMGGNYLRLRKFKEKFKEAFNLVNEYYEHNCKIEKTGIKLIHSKTDIEGKYVSRTKAKAIMKAYGCDNFKKEF